MRGTSSTPEPQKKRAGYARWGRFLLGGTALAATTYMSVQCIRCRRALHDAVDKLASYPAKTVHPQLWRDSISRHYAHRIVLSI